MDEEAGGAAGRVASFTSLNPFRRHKKPPSVAPERRVSPEYTAGFFSLLTFQWMSKLISIGYQRPLERNDIWLLNPNRDTHKLAGNLNVAFHEAHLKGSKRPLAKAIYQTFKVDFIIGGIACFVTSMVQVFIPFIVKYIITFVVDAYVARHEGGQAPHIGKGIGLVLGLTVMQILSSIGENHFFYRGMMVGGQVRSSLISIIFSKSMTISSRAKVGGKTLKPPPAGIESGSEEEKQHYAEQLKKADDRKQQEQDPDKDKVNSWSNGRIVNLMSTDTYRIDQASGWLHMIWASPIAMVVTIVLLLINLTYSALVGIAFIFFAIPFLGIAVSVLFKRRAIINQITDKRISITQEVLQSIRFVKYYSWEPDFMKRLTDVRGREIGNIRILLALRNCVSAIANAIPTFSSMLAFITFSLSKHPLNPAPVFSSLALFNQLRMPLMILPMVIGLTTDASQSLIRIEEFLLSEDTEDTIKLENGEGSNALELCNASFTWEQNSPPDPDELLVVKGEESRHEKEEAKQNARKAKKEAKKAEKAKRKASKAGAQPGSVAPLNSAADENPTPTSPPTPETPPFSIESINLQVGKSELIAVIGGVGSGKSSLLYAIAGEMREIGGYGLVNGTRALCPQLAWIQNSTLRDNITFGKELDTTKYDQIIEACSLSHDLRVLPHGSLTEIGERGINLSGGQKHRISLARAIYFDADIILLDDPLAAVDAHVGTDIMNNAICGLLKHKCRILATHQLQVLHHCDRIVMMEDGRIVACDTFTNLMASNVSFQNMMAAVNTKEWKESNNEIGVVPNVASLQQQENIIESQDSLMQEEDRPVEAVPWAVYGAYWKSTGSILVLPFLLLALCVGQGTSIVSNLWLAWWSDNHFKLSTGAYAGVYSALGAAQALLLLLFTIALSIFGTEASKRILQRAMARVLRAPISFFDTTPQGRIMNRFSKDIDVMDNNLTEAMRIAVTTIAMVISVFILIIAYYYYFAVALGPLFIGYLLFSAYYRASAREIKRHEAVLRSSVFARFTEAISGTATIRAYGVQEMFSLKLIDSINEMDAAYYLTFANQRWLSVRLDAIGVVFFAVTGILVVTDRFSISPAIAGLILSYLVSITQLLQFTVRQVADVENHMNAAERLHYYGTKIPEEAPAATETFKLHGSWPEHGEITFANVKMRYREGLPLILNSLNLQVKPGEKLGIVGRTGAGKSSIMNVLFRVVELSSGSIAIDGLDISTVGLHDLRSRMSIIPQDPTLFRGTIRSNLDPFNEHSDLDLWTALRQAHLIDSDPSKSSENGVKLDSVVESEGTNFSLGQRQLMALARALVRGSQIIVCDEATSSIDYEIDRKVQDTIVNGFRDKTLLCIAHRLKTIIGYDRICVIDSGQVAELDTPTALFDRAGAFRRMCDESKIDRDEILRRQANVHRGRI